MHTHHYIQGEYLHQRIFGNITLKDNTLLDSGACQTEAEMFQKLQEKMDDLLTKSRKEVA